jgi:carbonic anhydrase
MDLFEKTSEPGEEAPLAVGRGAGADEAARLLHANREWAEARVREDPKAFDRLAQGQSPPFLFVGCCDSRKPLDTITRAAPGDLFIHRNIANLVAPGDPAVAAVLEFAVLTLQVRHLIVCGHTRCGGVGAALSGVEDGALGTWLSPVRELVARHREELDGVEDPEAREDHLSALNVIAQLENALAHPGVRRRLEGEGPPLHLHGWIFQVESGRLQALALPVERWREEGLLPAGVAGSRNG